MSEGITCYERDEELCADEMCLRTGCRLRNAALSHPAAADNNASAEAITDDQITYANELAEDRRREWTANASAEARLREADTKIAHALKLVEGFNLPQDCNQRLFQIEDDLKEARKAISTHPHTSDCDRFKHFAPDGGKAPIRADAPDHLTVKTSAELAHASDCEKQGEHTLNELLSDIDANNGKPSDRPADVTESELSDFLYKKDTDVVIRRSMAGSNARAILAAFIVVRR